MYDVDLVFSWTRNEYEAILKGYKHGEVDEMEKQASVAMIHRKAQNAKKVSMRELYDAKKAHREVDTGKKEPSKVIDLDLYRKAQEDMKSWSLHISKGG